MSIGYAAGNKYLNAVVTNLMSVGVALASGVTAGSLLVAFAATNANENQTFSDNNGNTWTTLVQNQWQANLANGISCGYAKNANAGATTVSNSSATNAARNLIVVELTGADTSSPVDGTQPSDESDSSTNPDPGSLTTTASGVVIGFAAIYPTASPTPGTGFTSQFAAAALGSLYNLAIEDQLTSAGSHDANWQTAEGHWVAMAVAFKVASGGGGILLPQLERSGFRGSFRGMR